MVGGWGLGAGSWESGVKVHRLTVDKRQSHYYRYLGSRVV